MNSTITLFLHNQTNPSWCCRCQILSINVVGLVYVGVRTVVVVVVALHVHVDCVTSVGVVVVVGGVYHLLIAALCLWFQRRPAPSRSRWLRLWGSLTLTFLVWGSLSHIYIPGVRLTHMYIPSIWGSLTVTFRMWGLLTLELTSDREYSSVLSPNIILMFGRTLGCLLKAKLRLALPSLQYPIDFLKARLQ